MKAYLFIIFLLAPPAFCEDIEFQFHVYRVEPTIGLALEERLIAGGEAATGAMAKLPDFVGQRRVTELGSLSLSVPPDKRVRKTSSESTIKLPSHEAVDGLEVEVELLSDDGSIDFYFYGAYTSAEKDQPLERTVTSHAQGKNGIPMLLCRWQMEKDWLLLIGKATGPASGKSAKPGKGSAPLIYIESAFYPSGPSATAGRDLLASTRIPCINRQKGKAEMIAWVDDENILESDQPGFTTSLNPSLYDDGTMDLTAKCSYITQAGGRTRLENGDRVRRLEIREVSETLQMKQGILAGKKSKLAANEDIESKEDNYVAAFRFALAPSE